MGFFEGLAENSTSMLRSYGVFGGSSIRLNDKVKDVKKRQAATFQSATTPQNMVK